MLDAARSARSSALSNKCVRSACETSKDRANWLVQNQGLRQADAQRKVMDEFPQLFTSWTEVEKPAQSISHLLQSSDKKRFQAGYISGREDYQGSPEENPPTWPESVKVLNKESGYEVVDKIYEEMVSLDRGQFSTSRYALLFEASPKMHEVDVRVGFYTSVYGLGRHPSETIIRSVTSTNETPHPELGSLQNFWRRLG